MSSAATTFIPEASLIPRLNRITLKDRVVQVTSRLERPDIVVIDDFLSVEECDFIVAAAKSKMQRSTVMNEQTGSRDVHPARTSTGAHFDPGELAIAPTIEARIAELIRAPANYGEVLQVLNYQVGERYLPHYDYFPPEMPGSKEHLKYGGQRVATLLLYLNDVEAGGETVFPLVGNMRVLPKKGSVLYFSYLNRYGQVDPITLHGGEPVSAGEKWVATKWIRQGPFG
jgi:prolyl 4-hydroxylase